MVKSKSKGKVLIVEDDPDLNEAFSMVLGKEGYEVSGSFNGKEALEQIEKDVPDIILLDLLMPAMSGEEFLRKLDRKKFDVPVVVLTNLDTQQDIEEVQRLGADRYILKAWASPADLTRVVKDTLAES